MAGYPSIYATVVFDLHQRVKSLLDDLNNAGQIDLDQSGYPYLISVDRVGPNFVGTISRNNQKETFTVNPRKRAAPIYSWNPNDGFQRPVKKQTAIVQAPVKPNGPQTRARTNVTPSMMESLIDDILSD